MENIEEETQLCLWLNSLNFDSTKEIDTIRDVSEQALRDVAGLLLGLDKDVNEYSLKELVIALEDSFEFSLGKIIQGTNNSEITLKDKRELLRILYRIYIAGTNVSSPPPSPPSIPEELVPPPPPWCPPPGQILSLQSLAIRILSLVPLSEFLQERFAHASSNFLSDGLLLCYVVLALEQRMGLVVRKDAVTRRIGNENVLFFAGVETHPRSRASRLKNVELALKVVRGWKQFSPRILFNGPRIVDGIGDEGIKFLNEILSYAEKHCHVQPGNSKAKPDLPDVRFTLNTPSSSYDEWSTTKQSQAITPIPKVKEPTIVESPVIIKGILKTTSRFTRSIHTPSNKVKSQVHCLGEDVHFESNPERPTTPPIESESFQSEPETPPPPPPMYQSGISTLKTTKEAESNQSWSFDRRTELFSVGNTVQDTHESSILSPPPPPPPIEELYSLEEEEAREEYALGTQQPKSTAQSRSSSIVPPLVDMSAIVLRITAKSQSAFLQFVKAHDKSIGILPREKHATRLWLFRLGFNLLRTQVHLHRAVPLEEANSKTFWGYEGGPFLGDPFRNGQVLYELTGILRRSLTGQTTYLHHLHEDSKSFPSAKQRIDYAFDALGEASQAHGLKKSLEETLLNEQAKVGVLSGGKEIWTILYALSLAFPVERGDRERTDWESLHGAGLVSSPDFIDEIDTEAIASGQILREIAQHTLKVKMTSPRTRRTSLAAMERCLTILGLSKLLPCSVPIAAQRIHDGDLKLFLTLVEHLPLEKVAVTRQRIITRPRVALFTSPAIKKPANVALMKSSVGIMDAEKEQTVVKTQWRSSARLKRAGPRSDFDPKPRSVENKEASPPRTSPQRTPPGMTKNTAPSRSLSSKSAVEKENSSSNWGMKENDNTLTTLEESSIFKAKPAQRRRSSLWSPADSFAEGHRRLLAIETESITRNLERVIRLD